MASTRFARSDSSRRDATAAIYTNQVWKNFWTTQVTHTFNLRRMDIRLTRGGPRMEVPQGYTTDIVIRNRASAQTSWNVEATITGNEDGGHSRLVEATAAFRPGPRWQVSVARSFLRQVDTQQYITSLAGGPVLTYGRRYVFGQIDRSTYSMQFRATYTLKPDMTLDVYAEPFAASGAYTNIGALAAAGARAMIPETSVAAPDFNVRSFRSNVVLKWEYRQGITLFLVWQQDRNVNEAIGTRIGLGDPFRSLTEPGNNYFVVKTSFWLPVK